MKTIIESNEKGYTLLRRGKVRDIYHIGNPTSLMIIACDRISAFDCVLPTPIPGKGIILTKLSNFWFEKTKHIVPNHLIDTDPDWMDWYWDDDWYYEELRGRVVIVRKAKPLPIEAIVRGYLAGSGWKEYKATGTLCGLTLPAGLRESDRLPEPLFTPSSKSNVHDENITYEAMGKLIGPDLARKVRDISLALYSFAAAYAREKNIIVADTKFEFGLVDGELTLIDEILTPDSSRFWPCDAYLPGGPQPSYDKQYVRDYLEGISWGKSPPAPALPDWVVDGTVNKYNEILARLTS